MKLVMYNNYQLGLYQDDKVYNLSESLTEINAPTPQDMINAVIADFEGTYRARILEIAEKVQPIPMDQVHLRPPLPRPGKIVAMAANYFENGALSEPKPLNGFLKSPESVIGEGETVVLPAGHQAAVFHHEAELGVVIGKTAANVSEKDAYSHIFGYVNFNDVSARGLHPTSFLWMKSHDTFGPMGPYLVTADEIADAQNLQVRLWVNGEIRQDYNTSDMGHKIPKMIEWLTSIVQLDPGDLIASGTNHQGLGPIQNGDVMEMEIAGLGKITVNVSDELNREWHRGTDSDMADWVAGRTAEPPTWAKR
jgi:2-keto-4-pentenoate hydratase/2-oxohepta-3-ene-1,7-dioic acid hydratase in catechol pathway